MHEVDFCMPDSLTLHSLVDYESPFRPNFTGLSPGEVLAMLKIFEKSKVHISIDPKCGRSNDDNFRFLKCLRCNEESKV